MKRKYMGVAYLCLILLLNIVFTQYMVHQYSYENYEATLIFMALNLLLFPIAILLYKQDKKRMKDVNANEQ